MSKRHLKKVSVELITRLGNPSIYATMDRIRQRHHRHIRKAKIGLAWKKSIKPDRDGHILLGKCRKASDLQRELSDYDFIILLNKEVWEHEKFGHKRQKALLDHELCHAAQAYDKHGKRMKNDRGKYVFRMRKHNIEEFREIVERHGLYKDDLVEFAKSIMKGMKKHVHRII
jgi:hypothetical protein